ncbi:MAG TPA: DUF4919 domain-containing protein, partial [Pyrinomonadaceae bacterium]|nr:DUF4919 domain-containing protein [Pyrinomonadaceae bacterium]
MKNLTRSLLLCALCVLSIGVIDAQTPKSSDSSTLQNVRTSEYKELVEKVKGGDLSIDFVRLRAAFLDWANDECNQTDAPDRDQMVKAFEAKQYLKAAELAEAVLDYEFVNRGLHLAAAAAYKEINNPDKEKFHQDVAQKLLDALLRSGDGKTAKTAIKVHTIREEYQVMKELGYTVSSQSLVFDKQYGSFDVLDGKDKDGKAVSMYFDINSFFGG